MTNPLLPPTQDPGGPLARWLGGEVVDGVRIVKHPRLVGLVVLALSVACFVGILRLSWFAGWTSLTAMALVGGLFVIGLYYLVVGQPKNADGVPPGWWKSGLLVSFALGLSPP